MKVSTTNFYNNVKNMQVITYRSLKWLNSLSSLLKFVWKKCRRTKMTDEKIKFLQFWWREAQISDLWEKTFLLLNSDGAFFWLCSEARCISLVMRIRPCADVSWGNHFGTKALKWKYEININISSKFQKCSFD